ncbi:uncharacterized protein LOC135495882 [Lineus longissimus]|uniref:uncharacterized protein LOC135495882 n=1 Tax=Lineus longissimus TaxID=88925 RepID=UPI002B4E6FBC
MNKSSAESVRSLSRSYSARHQTRPTTAAITHSECDPFLCRCGPCRSFYKRHFGPDSESHLGSTALHRSTQTSSLFKSKELLKKGDRVIVWGERKGFVRFVGLLQEDLVAPEVFVGVQLDDNIGSTHNGVYRGKRYFHCPRGHGAMVKYSDVRQCTVAEKRPPLTGNYMFPSFKEIQEQRRKRREQDPGFDVGCRSWSGSQEFSLFRAKITPQKLIFDTDDVAYKDSLKKVRRPAGGRHQQEANKLSPQERRIQKWREEFGGDDRADQMVQTLQKLYKAYDHGLTLKKNNDLYDSDYDE